MGMPVEKHKANEEAIFNEFFKVIFRSRSRFKEDYITDPKNTCYKFIDSLTGTCHKSKDFKELLEDCFERIDDYTDRCSEGLPDFYLRSKVDRVPDLAIEVKTLQRDYDRFANYNESSEIKDHKLTIGDFELVIKLNPPGFIFPPPKKVRKLWNEFENELKNLKKDLEYIIDRMNAIEKELENEDQDTYVKDLKKEKKEKLKEIVCDIHRESKDFVIHTDFRRIFPCLGIHIDKCEFEIGYVKKEIKDSKEEWLKQYIENFLENYFSIKLCMNFQEKRNINVKNPESFTFIVSFDPYWKSEDVNFHVEKIEEFIEESKKKFENLRGTKSDKLDKNPHLELLLIKVTSFMIETFKDRVKELYEKLMQRGYNYPFYPVKDLDNPLNLSEFFVDPNNSSVLSKFYMICMNSCNFSKNATLPYP